MRLFAALLLSSGCDSFWDLQRYPIANDRESKTHDEDGDKEADAFDLCPHDPVPTTKDSDEDGIGDPCDPRVDVEDERYFFSLENGSLDGLIASGPALADPETNSIVLGDLGVENSALVVRELELVENVRIVIGATIIDAPDSGGGFAELGAYARHRAFTDSERGDNCLVGRSNGMPNTTFIELNQDDMDKGETLVDANFEGAIGSLRFDQSATTLGCVYNSDKLSGTHTMPISPDTPPLGRVAVRAGRLIARIHYVLVIVPKPQ